MVKNVTYLFAHMVSTRQQQQFYTKMVLGREQTPQEQLINQVTSQKNLASNGACQKIFLMCTNVINIRMNLCRTAHISVFK
ncbi:hypothetical protein N476_14780 [Pseudoalteromonas luteoviolacea H33]|uniref:Uncharacterized protein n=1 Tax=Pseudoalteromonas luteoviolacea H33 TaxID=1365251 RepID=A0A162AJ78_9GAMM|nr:hypothetical protein N476_14780 [Pseudoalteromonas luteoviolacea H33]KZN74978.1 hypothetical protein N477_20420 [Pseudoalteromonas luteoviolacea H33-S]